MKQTIIVLGQENNSFVESLVHLALPLPIICFYPLIYIVKLRKMEVIL